LENGKVTGLKMALIIREKLLWNQIKARSCDFCAETFRHVMRQRKGRRESGGAGIAAAAALICGA
jgi:hypothetical protein